jgi:aspartate/glutamate racemase
MATSAIAGPGAGLEQQLSAARLLAAGDAGGAVPGPVERTVRFLAAAGIWFQVSRNREARSCRDAAHKRSRLGHEGIPLWDELKSYLGAYVDATGRRRYVMAHCRGDERLRFDALAAALGAAALPERLDEADMAAIGMDYGLVNPFTPLQRAGDAVADVVQVFDAGLLRRIGIPGTMMTNAGDFTWAVELYPDELIARIPGAMVAPIAEPDPEEPSRVLGIEHPRPIGIITGNAPESGITLWGHINAHVRTLLEANNCGDVSMPTIAVQSFPEMGLSMELDTRREAVWAALGQRVWMMCEDGVRILTLACNTTPYFTPEIRTICDEYGAEFLSVAETTAAWLKARDVPKIALLGIRYVTGLDEWSAYREPLRGIEVEQLSPKAIDDIHDLAFKVKTHGPTVTNLNHFRDILRKEVTAPYVVVALTELSLLMRAKWKGDSGKVLMDPLAVYGEAIARRYLGLPFPATVPPANEAAP